MNLVAHPTEPLPGEAAATRAGQIAVSGLMRLKEAVIETFRLIWEDPANTLARIGPNAVEVFSQHYDGVLLLLRYYLRTHRALAATAQELADAKTDPPAWLMTHPEHPLAQAVLAEFPPQLWIPPLAYIPHEDGTITLA